MCPDDRLPLERSGRAHHPEEPGENSPHIDINDRHPLGEGEGQEGVSGVAADSGKSLELGERPGYPSSLFDHAAGQRMQPHCTVVVPHPAPGNKHLSERRSGKSPQTGESPEESWVGLTHAVNLGLLEHDFRQEDAVRVTGLPPSQNSSVAPVPPQESPDDALEHGPRWPER